MGKALLIVVAVALFVYALFDLIAAPKQNVRFLPKPVWFLVLLIAPIGPILWLLFGHARQRPRPGPAPKRIPPILGPDDDPDYLRGL